MSWVNPEADIHFFQSQEFTMNNKSVLSAIMAITLAISGSVFAQGNSRQNDNCRDGPGRCGNDNSRQRNDARRPVPQQYQGRANNDGVRDERGAGPDHAFRRGGRLPQQYRSNQYVVNDWRGHHLTAPPRGYHWVQTGGDYVLVAIATGLILQLLLNN
jgi:Ni/Co efflux regulator RcnB